MSSKAVISSSVSKMAASSSSTKIVSKKVSSSSAVTSKTYSYRSGAAPDDSNVTIEYIHDVSNVSRLEVRSGRLRLKPFCYTMTEDAEGV